MNDALTHRIEQLITKHEALLQTNAALEQECDSLKNRLALASQRLDILIARLPHPNAIATAPDL